MKIQKTSDSTISKAALKVLSFAPVGAAILSGISLSPFSRGSNEALAAANTSPIIQMQAQDSKGNSLDPSVPFYYSVAHSIGTKSAPIVPVMLQHNGTNSVVFNSSTGVDANSYIGVYVPTGSRAVYRYRLMAQVNNVCKPSTQDLHNDWVIYDSALPSSTVEAPLQLGVGVLPSVVSSDGTDLCLQIEWRILPDAKYPGNLVGLYEQPNAAQVGIAHMPATKVIQGQGAGSSAGAIQFGVSELFGNVGESLQISTGSYPPISPVLNSNPTDDGMVWGIAMKGAAGLYQPVPGASPLAVDLGSSQFVGHNSFGTTFGDMMWGMTTPLLKYNTQTLRMNNSLCPGGSCFVPMFSDFTSANATTSNSGTTPFLLPRSVHPWDGQVSEIAVRNLLNSDGTPGPVERLKYSFNYRPHMDFQAKQMGSGLWYDSALLAHSPNGGPDVQQPVDIYLVRSDGSYSQLKYQDLMNSGMDKPTTMGKASDLWLNFCKDIHKYTTRCAPVEVPAGATACGCSFSGSNIQVERIVFSYANVAMSLQGSGEAFQAFVLTTRYYNNSQSGLVSDAHNIQMQAPSFSKADPVTNDSYYMNVGTLDDLNAACVGFNACHNLLAFSQLFEKWFATNISVQHAAAVAPDGTPTAEYIQETTANGQHRVAQYPNLIMGKPYVLSAYVKSETRDIRLFAKNSKDGFFGVGTCDPQKGTAVGGQISAAANGWYRCSVSFTPSVSENGVFIEGVVPGGLSSYPGDGSSGFYLWGAQLEQGTAPSPYFPTGGVAN